MSNLSELRKVVELPPNYRVRMPVKERKAILKNALDETRLSNAMQGRKVISNNLPKKPVQTGFSAWGSDRARVVRCVQVYGPITVREISNILRFTIRRAQRTISNVKAAGYVVDNGETRSVNGKLLKLFITTPSGVEYGAKK